MNGTRTADPRRTHLLTVAVEEHFHDRRFAHAIARHHDDRFEPRVEAGLAAWRELLAAHGATATFFVPARIAERHPAAVRALAAAGHEVASMGWEHRAYRAADREELATDARRSRPVVEAASGLTVDGFRAPWWIAPQDAGLLRELASQGWRYDASLREGGAVADGAPGPAEFAVTQGSFAGMRLALDGDHARLLPEAWLEEQVSRWSRVHAAPAVLSFRSWELDPAPPPITGAGALSAWLHRVNLARLPRQLERMLRRWRFQSIADHLGIAPRHAGPLPPHYVPEPDAGPEEGEHVATVPVTVVVPVHNEQGGIDYLLRAMEKAARALAPRHELRLLVVDDGSTDGTWDELEQAARVHPGLALVRHERNRGVGAAILTGIRAASTELVASVDCDCSYDPCELAAMLPMLEHADVVTASPYHPQGRVANVPGWRLFLSRTLSRLYQRELGVPIHTWTSCFRAYRRSAVADLEPERGGFLGVAELLVRVLRRGGRVVEHPATLERRLLGTSKMKLLRTILGHLGLLWQVRRGRI